MTLLGQNNRYLQLTGAIKNDAIPGYLEGGEYLSLPYLFQVRLYSDKKNVGLKQYIGQPLSIQLASEPDGRFIHGIVTELQQQGSMDGYYHYNVTLEPWLVLLKMTRNTRIYQSVNVPDMVSDIIRRRGFSDLRMNLSNTYPKVDFCMQYRESDFDFISRQLAAVGIFYFFIHEQDKHILVLADNPGAFPVLSTSVLPYQSLKGKQQGVGLSAWNMRQRVIPGIAEMNGYNVSNAVPVWGHASASGDVVNERLSIFDTDSAEQQQQLSAKATLCMEQWESRACVARAISNYPTLQAGQQFLLSGTPDDDGQYVLSGQYLTAESNIENGTGLFSSQVELCRANKKWRPPLTIPRPNIAGVLSAKVVGPASEEIHTDEMGRIKIQFHWDKEHSGDDSSSCWVRVNQFGNGARFGAQFIPRVGSEVLVSFIDGDPDRPVVTGTVYNGVKKPPFILPGQKTQSGVVTRSIPGGTIEQGHQLCFEDKIDNEFILLSSQKDLLLKARNTLSANIEHDVLWDIKGKRETHLEKGDEILLLHSGNKKEILESGDFATVVNNGNYNVDVSKGKVALTSGESYTITAKQNIELKVGDSSLIITPSGITMKTAIFNIESSGTIKLNSASTTIEGSGMLNLKSSGMTTLSGTLVQIDADTMAILKGLLTKIG